MADNNDTHFNCTFDFLCRYDLKSVQARYSTLYYRDVTLTFVLYLLTYYCDPNWLKLGLVYMVRLINLTMLFCHINNYFMYTPRTQQ